ncbi:helix-turn-helix domain-containing protein [Paracoccus marinaquae]|uniref:Helix-turn-helix domain-containing protein n=1 Tax=Paracoccus marinaquae TaxID=2841926 RepID=A0ABS6AMI5_9RHOB|nr:helix-turn-helix domain-containing protein [Paracoccus marinaquae]MBU3030850.1 helix-turn-helix domain-containing protein [Paracoccus marinaquae]
MTADELTEIDVALAEISVLRGTLTRLEASLEQLRGAALQHSLSQLPACEVPPTEHRRAHRSGRPAIIDTDPELQAFILARLDRLTYHQVAAAIAEHFPPDRHISHATVHR